LKVKQIKDINRCRLYCYYSFLGSTDQVSWNILHPDPQVGFPGIFFIQIHRSGFLRYSSSRSTGWVSWNILHPGPQVGFPGIFFI